MQATFLSLCSQDTQTWIIAIIITKNKNNNNYNNNNNGSNGEFIVHTKHTCDNCYRRPIVGQRYTSDVRMNFDLCGKCFTEYTGPDIQLKEAVLIRDKKLSRDFVLKLRINNCGEGESYFLLPQFAH